MRCGTICGTPVKDILLDTGSTRTLVKKELAPRNRMVDAEVAIRCAHGNTIVYPLADVEIKIGGQNTVQAGVSDTLPVPVLLGRDVPELLPLVSTGEDILGREKTRMTRKQKRINSRQYARAEKKTDGSSLYDLDLIASELKQLQKADHTVDAIRGAAEGEVSTAGIGFFTKDGLVYRRWAAPGSHDD